MSDTKKVIQPLQRRAMFVPETLNKDERTVDVTFSTETPVRMYSYEMGGWFDEILSHDPAHVRMDRINKNGPVLDSHNRYQGVRASLGIVEKARIENREGRATLRFSNRPEVDGVWQDVCDGILKGISGGYRVYAYEVTQRDGDVPLCRAVDWEPFEVSFELVPADFNSSVRSQGHEGNEVSVRTLQNLSNNDHTNMDENQTNGGAASTTTTTATTDATRAAAAAPAPTPVNVENERRAAVEAERQRTTGIMDAVRKANLSPEFAQTLIAEGKTIDQARAAIIDKWAEGDPNKGQRNTSATVTVDEADKRRNALECALMLRANPHIKLTDAEVEMARQYRGLDLIDMARESVEATGVKTRGMDKREIAVASLNLTRSAGALGTSDFPIILGNTINRTLRAEYAIAPQTFQAWARQTTAKDFREKTVAQLGEVGSFKKVKEGGEYESDSLGEAKESYKLEKFGKIINVTWETLINDDLDAFSRLPQKIAQAARRTQSDIVYGILSKNPKMGDNVQLFHANHGNLAAAGTVINIDNIGLGRKAIRTQKGINDEDFLNLSPGFILTGPAQEQYALQYTSNQYDPTEPSKVNVWRNTLQPICEPRITGNEWYLICPASQVDTVEYAFLEGEGELFTEMKEGFLVDGLQVKARMVFAAKAIDWRGMYKNPGALPG
jgi:hypothetical protein